MFIHGGARKQYVSQRSELCAEMITGGTRKVGGVCIFDRVWKRGIWDPTKKGSARFIVKRVCDQGIEYVSTADDALPQGPHFWNPASVDISGKNHTSKLIDSDKNLVNKVPATCFTGNDPTTLASTSGIPCNSDISSIGFCELKMLKNHPYSKRSLNGNWWIQYTNPIKRSFRICVGGVTLVTATENDPLYVQVENLPENFDGTPKVCIRKIKNTPTEFLCSVEGVNQCVKYVSPNDRMVWAREISNYIKVTSPAEYDKYVTKTTKVPLLKVINDWEPESEQDRIFLDTQNEKLAQKSKMSQITKVDKNGAYSSTDVVNCDQIIMARSREK